MKPADLFETVAEEHVARLIVEVNDKFPLTKTIASPLLPYLRELEKRIALTGRKNGLDEEQIPNGVLIKGFGEYISATAMPDTTIQYQHGVLSHGEPSRQTTLGSEEEAARLLYRNVIDALQFPPSRTLEVVL